MAVNETAPPKSKKELAKELGVSRASLYYKPKLPAKDFKLKTEIEKVMEDNKAYGHKRIAWALGVNKKRVLRVMKLFGLKPKRSRKKPEKPKDSGQEPADIPNLMTDMFIDAPNQAWASDFTYLPHFGRFLYLATVEDVFTRQVVGWELSFRHDAVLVAGALKKALAENLPPLIIHSDQGSEYNCRKYFAFLKELSILPSMSKKASPWQNGKQESFYSGFKLELGHPEIYETVGELVEAIAVQIHYYNHLRIHTALKCPPAVFAERCAEMKSKENAMVIKTKNESSNSIIKINIQETMRLSV